MISRLAPATKILSHLVGACADITVPPPLRTAVIGSFARIIQANTAETELPLKAYRSCGEYFARGLKAGARPLADSPLVAPVDGTCRLVCTAQHPIPQIKGRHYEVSDLLQSSAAPFVNGSVAVFYLAPHNYHRIHAPLSGQILAVRYVKGALWPVNTWGLTNVDRLFCVNERIVLSGESPLGPWALVMVGATNVGRMELSFLSAAALAASKDGLITGQWLAAKGAELGRFRLGSTVVLVTSFSLRTLEQARPVRYGESIILS